MADTIPGALPKRSLLEDAIKVEDAKPTTTKKPPADKPTTTRTTNTPQKVSRNSVEKFREPLTNFYSMASLAMVPIKMEIAEAIANATDKCVDSVLNLATTNSSLRKFLEKSIDSVGWVSVLVAHAPILLAIAMAYVPSLKDNEMLGILNAVSSMGSTSATE